MTIFRRCPTCHELFQGKKCIKCCNASDKRSHLANDSYQFYNSTRWRKCRDRIIAKYFGFDIWALGEGNLVKPDKIVVHHIIERDKAPGLALRMDNLIPVSPSSHEEIHSCYVHDKQYALTRIAKGLEEFRRRFEK